MADIYSPLGGMSGNMDQDIAYYRLKDQYPTLEEDAAAAGWRPDGRGNYTRIYNGVSQTLPMAMVASNLQEQKQASQLSTPVQVGGGQDYLSRIQQFMGTPPTINYGASTQSYDNPYEQQLMQLMNNPDSIANTNVYKFRFNQGQDALERSAAAKGMLSSGNTLSALSDYGQKAASQEYGDEFNRLNSAVGQRNQFNLGRAGASNQELGLRQQGYQDQSGIALKSLLGYDENRINANKVAASNAVGTGRINAGEKSRTSTW